MANPVWIYIYCGVYGCLFALMIGLRLHDQSQWKLRRKHDEELETLRGKHDAERDALQGRPRVIASRPESPYTTAYNIVALPETLKMLQQEQDLMLRRLDQLEQKQRSGVA
jgi:hypothetical protein